MTSKDLSNEDVSRYYDEAQLLETYPPQKTIKVYKLFKTKKSHEGKIYPLFIDKANPTPLHEWVTAKFIPTKGFKERAGWHSGTTPYAPHLMKIDRRTMPGDRVWAECEIPDDYNWNTVLTDNGAKQLLGIVPISGFYFFNMRKNMSWKISGAIKINRLLSHKESDCINKLNGIDSNYVKYHD